MTKFFQIPVPRKSDKTSKGLSDRKLAIGPKRVASALRKAAEHDQLVNRRVIVRSCLADPLTTAQIEMYDNPKWAGLIGTDTSMFKIGAHMPSGTSVSVKDSGPKLR